jgi:hypothetical protein
MTFKHLSLLATLAFLASPMWAGEVKTAKLVGSVTDESGKPVAGATVTINGFEDEVIGLDMKLLVGKTDKSGRYELTVHFREPEIVHFRSVVAWARGYVRNKMDRSIALRDGETKTLDLKLTPGEPGRGHPPAADGFESKTGRGSYFLLGHWTEVSGSGLHPEGGSVRDVRAAR